MHCAFVSLSAARKRVQWFSGTRGNQSSVAGWGVMGGGGPTPIILDLLESSAQLSG